MKALNFNKEVVIDVSAVTKISNNHGYRSAFCPTTRYEIDLRTRDCL